MLNLQYSGINIKINIFLLVAIQTYVDGSSANFYDIVESKQTTAAAQNTLSLGRKEGGANDRVHFQIGKRQNDHNLVYE